MEKKMQLCKRDNKRKFSITNMIKSYNDIWKKVYKNELKDDHKKTN